MVEQNFFSGEKIYKANIAVTYKCNQECLTCNIWKREAEEELSKEQLKKFFQRNSYNKWLSLTGGEPFLRQDLVEIVKSAEKELDSFYILNIPTNGQNQEKIVNDVKDILKLGIPNVIVSVSINGPKKLHDKISGRKESFENALNTFKELKEIEETSNKFKTFLEYTQSPNNIGKFEETFEKVKEHVSITEKDFAVTFFHTSKHYYGNDGKKEGKNNVEEIVEKQRKLPKTPVQLVNQVFLELAKDELEENSLPCEALKSSVFIDPLGNVYPCVIDNTKIGNIVEESYSLEEMLDKVDKDKVLEKCQGCWLPCESNQRIMSNFSRSGIEYIKKRTNLKN